MLCSLTILLFWNLEKAGLLSRSRLQGQLNGFVATQGQVSSFPASPKYNECRIRRNIDDTVRGFKIGYEVFWARLWSYDVCWMCDVGVF